MLMTSCLSNTHTHTHELSLRGCDVLSFCVWLSSRDVMFSPPVTSSGMFKVTANDPFNRNICLRLVKELRARLASVVLL